MFSQRPVRYFFRFSQKSLNFLIEGWRVNLKSHLSYDWSHLYGTLRRKKIDKFTAKQKKKKSSEVPQSKNNFEQFFDISGLLRDFRKFKFSLFFLFLLVFFILPRVFFTVPWVLFILPWVFFILLWDLFILPWFSLFCREFYLFCRVFSLFCSELFFILLWIIFTLP